MRNAMSDEDNARIGTRRSSSNIFELPSPFRRIFDKFPLKTYPANELPCWSPKIRDTNFLHVFTSKQGALADAPSFNPSCLKWQAYLKFRGVRFRTIPANNHASPSGVLPFLNPATGSCSAPSSQPVPANQIVKWVTAQTGKTEETSGMKHEVYTSLIDHRIRSAWLFTLYLDQDNAEAVAKQLYIYPVSSNFLVQKTLFYQLKQAAQAELFKTASYIREDELYLEAGNAFLALSTLLGDDRHFFGRDRPTLFDASVFAYTHLLLDESLNWQNTRLADSVKTAENLVQHRQRLLKEFFNR